MSDLIVALFLRTSQIEQQFPALDIALVGVGDSDSVCMAVGAVDDDILNVGTVSELGLDIEAGIGVGRRCDECVVGDGVGFWDTLIVATGLDSGRRRESEG